MSGAAAQYFSLRWNNHPVNLVSVFTGLYQVGPRVTVALVLVLRVLRMMVLVLLMEFNLSPRRSHW